MSNQQDTLKSLLDKLDTFKGEPEDLKPIKLETVKVIALLERAGEVLDKKLFNRVKQFKAVNPDIYTLIGAGKYIFNKNFVPESTTKPLFTIIDNYTNVQPSAVTVIDKLPRVKH